MLKPLEEKGGVSGTHIAKVVFVLAIIVAGILASTNGPDPKKMSSIRQTTFNPKVLGATISRNFLSLVPKAQKAGEGTVKKVQSFFGEKKDKVGTQAQKFFYSNAVNPILQQIDKLPKDDQEKIRKELCAPN